MSYVTVQTSDHSLCKLPPLPEGLTALYCPGSSFQEENYENPFGFLRDILLYGDDSEEDSSESEEDGSDRFNGSERFNEFGYPIEPGSTCWCGRLH